MNGLVRLALSFFVACVGLLQGGTFGPGAKAKLTLEQTMGPSRVSFTAQPPSISFAHDRVHLELQKDGKTIWVDPRTKEESEPAPRPERSADLRAVTNDEVAGALMKLGGFDEAAAKAAAGRRAATDDGQRAVVVVHESDLYFVRVGREKAVRLTATPEPEENVRLSEDDRYVSFVRGSNLYVVATDDARERQITSDGGPEKQNGKLDWVYQEEVYGRGNFQACWWSPSSRQLAFLAIDETGVPHHPIVDQIPDDPELEDTRYPKSGDPNPKAQLGVARAGDGKVTWVDLAKYAGSEPLIVRVGWTPKEAKVPEQVVFQVQDREQTWLDLNLADPADGKVTTLFRETSPSWVNVLEEPRWMDDGSFLWLSERTGYKHLYHYQLAASETVELLGAITSGEWEVRSILDVDSARKRIWFTASKDSAVGPNVYRVTFDGTGDGSGLTRLTQGAGSHAVEANADWSLFLDRVSSVAFPPEIRLCDGEDGHVIELLGRAEVQAIADYGYSQPELLQIPARDGFVMDATLVKPADLDPTKRYPIWLPTYSGPDAPSAGDRWSGDPWTQFLAQQGYAVFQVNNRTSSQKGLALVSKCYQQFGVQELADLEDALQWLAKTYPWADTSRVGISGWSYGGFMTAFALTHSSAFKLGVAGAGVYDWRLYDTIYTERYMKTPEHNPDGYAKTSCVAAAKDLAGYLVLAHGTLDDNVHFQNTVQFALALQKCDKDFETMIYPKSRHGLGSAEQNWHFRKLTWKAIRERL